jgi:hypothetical protein
MQTQHLQKYYLADLSIRGCSVCVFSEIRILLGFRALLLCMHISVRWELPYDRSPRYCAYTTALLEERRSGGLWATLWGRHYPQYIALIENKAEGRTKLHKLRVQSEWSSKGGQVDTASSTNGEKIAYRCILVGNSEAKRRLKSKK